MESDDVKCGRGGVIIETFLDVSNGNKNVCNWLGEQLDHIRSCWRRHVCEPMAVKHLLLPLQCLGLEEKEIVPGKSNIQGFH